MELRQGIVQLYRPHRNDPGDDVDKAAAEGEVELGGMMQILSSIWGMAMSSGKGQALSNLFFGCNSLFVNKLNAYCLLLHTVAKELIRRNQRELKT